MGREKSPDVRHFRFNRFKCKCNARFDRKFSGTNGRPSDVFHFFRSSRLEQKLPFHLRNTVSAGGWRRAANFFPPFPMFAGDRCSLAVAVFFYLFLTFLSFKMASASPMLERWPMGGGRIFT